MSTTTKFDISAHTSFAYHALEEAANRDPDSYTGDLDQLRENARLALLHVEVPGVSLLTCPVCVPEPRVLDIQQDALDALLADLRGELNSLGCTLGCDLRKDDRQTGYLVLDNFGQQHNWHVGYACVEHQPRRTPTRIIVTLPSTEP